MHVVDGFESGVVAAEVSRAQLGRNQSGAGQSNCRYVSFVEDSMDKGVLTLGSCMCWEASGAASK